MQPNTAIPAHIHPDAIYHDGQARILLGLTEAALARARREGRLRFTKQGHRVLYRGAWLLAWLEADADRARANQSPSSNVEGRRDE